MLYKSKLLTLETMVYSYCILMSIGIWAQVAICTHIRLLGIGLYVGRAPRTKETLPDFRE